MTKRTRRTHSAAFKAKVALAAVKGECPYCQANAFTEAVLGRHIRLSMDGKGSWRDNVFVERVWRSIK